MCTVTTVKPAFFKDTDFPHLKNLSIFEVCEATERVSGQGMVTGGQKIGALWRIYFVNVTARLKALSKGIEIKGIKINLVGDNPFLPRNKDGVDVPTTRLTFGNVPISVHIREFETAMDKMGLKPLGEIEMERVRGPDRKLTSWLSGRRYVDIEVPRTTLPLYTNVGGFSASIFYKERRENNRCPNCLEMGHFRNQCMKEEVCFFCKKSGHKKALCPEFKRQMDEKETRDKIGVERRAESAEKGGEIESEGEEDRITTGEEMTSSGGDTEELEEDSETEPGLEKKGGKRKRKNKKKNKKQKRREDEMCMAESHEGDMTGEKINEREINEGEDTSGEKLEKKKTKDGPKGHLDNESTQNGKQGEDNSSRRAAQIPIDGFLERARSRSNSQKRRKKNDDDKPAQGRKVEK